MIKPYEENLYNEICSWWKDSGECPPLPGMMVENGTFVLYVNDVPAMSLTTFLTQSKEIAYLEGFIKNPKFKMSLEKEGQELWDACFDFAKANNAKRIICYCLVDKLVDKYKRYGMSVSAAGLTSFVREF